jgi:trimeric autotransporter adhesin
MSAWPGSLQPSLDPGGAARSVAARGSMVSRRLLVALALACLALGVALQEGLGGATRPVASSVAAAHSYSRESLLSLPLAAQGPVSATLGANSPAYRVTPAAGGFRAASPGQHLAMGFTRGGVSVASGQGLLALGLRAVGYGATLRPVGAVTPRLEGERIVYSRPGVSEWYANGPLGLEQGFTIPHAPAGDAAGALTLSIALEGNLHASLTDGGRTLTLSRVGHPVLRYTDLHATDARGRTLHSSLALDGHRLLIRVDANGARYPLRIDPLVQQAELTGGGEVVGSGDDYRFGAAVALSSDGETALVSDPNDNSGAGAVWTFTYSNGAWAQQGSKLTNGTGFAEALAISGDGSTALISGSRGGGITDLVFVYTYSNGTWTQQAMLTPSVGSDEGSDFGGSVAISDDGDTALVSDLTDLGGGGVVPGPGAAWVFQRSGSSWAQQGTKLVGDCTSSCTGPNGTGEGGDSGFGVSVALSGTGTTALIGAYGGGYNGVGAAAAWVFTLSGSTWSQQGPVLSGAAGDADAAVALSDDGDTALVGGSEDNSGVGAAWVFQRSGSTWTQPGTELTANDTSLFGSSLALSDDGDTALIGAAGGNGVGSDEAFVFTDSNGSWTQQGDALTAGASANDLGYSVALSSCGSALIGAPMDTVGNEGQAGSAWVFTTGAGSCSGSGSGTGSTSGTGTGTAGGTGTSGSTGTSNGTGTSGGTGTHAGGASTGKGSGSSLAAQLGLPSTKACVSQRKLTIHIAEHITQAGASTKLKSAEILLAGHVIAKLKGSDLVAHVSLAGLKKGSFTITVKATTSAGKTLSASSTFHTCASSKHKHK